MKYSVFAAAILSASAAYAETPELTVYTYDSFVSDWGPGPAVEKAFEAQCGCDLKLIGAGDGAALLGMLRQQLIVAKQQVMVQAKSRESSN